VIINSTQNPNFITPDVVLMEQDPPASIAGASIGVVGVAVQATRGLVGIPTLVSSLQDYVAKFGDYTAPLKEDFMFMYNLFKQGVTTVKVVRVTDGSHASATLTASGSVFALPTPGSWGNSVTLTSVASQVTGYVDLTFRFGTKEVYTYPQVTFTNANDERYIGTVLQNATEQFVSITTVGASNPVGTWTFTGGTDGTLTGLSLNDTAYIGTNAASGRSGLVALEADDDVEIVAVPRTGTTIISALSDHVSLTTVTPRLAIAAPASGQTVAQVQTLMQAYNNDKLVITYPFLQIKNVYNNKNEYHTPTAFYAGLLSKLTYNVSPSRQAVLGVIGTERQLSRAEVDTLTQSRVSPITLFNGGFLVRNGINTSINPGKANITRRRAVNYFARTFEAGSQQFVSKNHTPQLREDIKGAFGSILQTEVGLNRIGNANGGKPYAVKCDAQNNVDATVKQGKLIVDVQISLWSNADFIFIRLDASEAKVVSIQ
jgi:hypothetical protein